MKRSIAPVIVSSAVGTVAALFVITFLMGWQIPLIVDDRAAVLTLAVLGFAMCSLGMSRVALTLGWRHPITLIGSGLGVLVLLLVIAVLAGWPVPFIADNRTALMAVVMIGLVKWGLAIASRVFLRA
jgi:hypothetical protein